MPLQWLADESYSIKSLTRRECAENVNINDTCVGRTYLLVF